MIYLDQKTNTKYKISVSNYTIKNNVKWLHLDKIRHSGNGPERLQFSIDFFQTLIIKGEFKKISQ